MLEPRSFMQLHDLANDVSLYRSNTNNGIMEYIYADYVT